MESLLLHYGYRIIFPLAVIEGPMLNVIAGFLVYSGYFNPYIVFALITTADILTDTWYWWVGTKVNTSSKFQKYIDKSDFLQNRMQMMQYFRDTHPGKTMLLGKQAYGLSVAIIMSAGMCQMGLSCFLLYSIPVSMIQSLILLTIGYYLGNSYQLIGQYITYPGIVIVVIVIVIALLYHKTTKDIAKNFDQQSSQGE